MLELRERTARAGKIDMRTLLQGWYVVVTPTSARFGNRAPHHSTVEKGRRPGTMPPPALLEAWARRKLGIRGLGWPMALAIKKRGIPATPILTAPGFIDKLKEIMKFEIDRATRDR